jgi:hypothetical protein
MKLKGELAIGGFQFSVGGIATDVENLVIVPLGAHIDMLPSVSGTGCPATAAPGAVFP